MNTDSDSSHEPDDGLSDAPHQASSADSSHSAVPRDFDTTGPPQPVPGKSRFPKIAMAVVSIAAAGSAVYALLGVSVSSCRGATRSSRLKWEERKQQIDADIEAIHQQPIVSENSVGPQQPNG
ncbi:MAG: hypothetical protein K8T91_07215 [Planctomycetes bacterium]|nr:hypothetical protein [Planctomycetota bacterium]